MTPEIKLWRAVIAQAVKDARDPKPIDGDFQSPEDLREEALRWLSQFLPAS